MQLGSTMIMGAKCVGKVHNMLHSYLNSVMKIGAYCVGKVQNMLPL